MTDQISKEVLATAVRRFRREAAACVLQAMAHADITFAEMAYRIGRREKTVRRWVMRLADGKRADKGDCLSRISDMAFACGCRLDFKFERIEEAALPLQEQREEKHHG